VRPTKSESGRIMQELLVLIAMLIAKILQLSY
jgi:hypothetical protein